MPTNPNPRADRRENETRTMSEPCPLVGPPVRVRELPRGMGVSRRG